MPHYYAIAEPDDAGGFWLSFPDGPGIISAATSAAEIVAQARDASQKGNYSQAVSLLQSASALQPSDSVNRDLAQAKAKVEEAKKAQLAQDLIAGDGHGPQRTAVWHDRWRFAFVCRQSKRVDHFDHGPQPDQHVPRFQRRFARRAECRHKRR